MAPFLLCLCLYLLTPSQHLGLPSQHLGLGQKCCPPVPALSLLHCGRGVDLESRLISSAGTLYRRVLGAVRASSSPERLLQAVITARECDLQIDSEPSTLRILTQHCWMSR
jgi:hypothetical protein